MRWPTAGAARIVADEDFDAAALVDAAQLLDDEAAIGTMRPRRAHSAVRARPSALAELVLALGERAALPTPGHDRAHVAGGGMTAEPVMRDRLTEEDLVRLGTDIQRRIGVKTSRHEPLARFTTMRVGGPADLFAEVHNLFELRAIVRFARGRNLPFFLIGRGSDLVISDAGMRGLVIYNRAQQHRREGTRLTADSGLPMAKAATLGKTEGLSGLEFGLAIPGTVGGAVWANAGAHESDVRSVLAAAGVLRADGTKRRSTATGWR